MSKRILQVIAGMHPRDGGPPSVVKGQSAALVGRGHQVEVVSSFRVGDELEVRSNWDEQGGLGIPLRLFPVSGFRALIDSQKGTAYLREVCQNFDVMFLHCIWGRALVNAGRAARAANVPYFVFSHGHLDRWVMAQSSRRKRLALTFMGTRSLLDNAAGILYGSADEANEAARLGFAAPAYVVPNGVNVISPASSSGQLVSRATLASLYPPIVKWQRIVLFFARIHPKKGLDILIEAFARIAPRYPGVGLLAAGIAQDEQYEARLRQRVVELNLDERIVITTDLVGPRGHLALDAADIFALPSHQEGFSMSIIEAMGRGLPVLITNRCHLNEVCDWDAGEVTEPTVDGLASGLAKLLSNEDFRLREIGANGAKIVSEQYTWPKVALRLERVVSGLEPRV